MCPIDEAAQVYHKCIEYLEFEKIKLTKGQKLRIKEIIRDSNKHINIIETSTRPTKDNV